MSELGWFCEEGRALLHICIPKDTNINSPSLQTSSSPLRLLAEHMAPSSSYVNWWVQFFKTGKFVRGQFSLQKGIMSTLASFGEEEILHLLEKHNEIGRVTRILFLAK